jgi:hypothetical protein
MKRKVLDYLEPSIDNPYREECFNQWNCVKALLEFSNTE